VQRLKTRVQFQAVTAAGIVARTAHFALHRMSLDAPPSTGLGSEGPQALFPVRDAWMGVILPKRWAKRAVTRNAIKRQVYSLSEAMQPPLPAAAHVVRLRAGFERAQFQSATSDALKRAVRAELQLLLKRAAS
jgi:ribonuclease P protein component